MQFSIGHPAYPADSINSYATQLDFAAALKELVKRGFARKEAREALHKASEWRHVTLSLEPMGVVEVQRVLARASKQ